MWMMAQSEAYEQIAERLSEIGEKFLAAVAEEPGGGLRRGKLVKQASFLIQAAFARGALSDPLYEQGIRQWAGFAQKSPGHHEEAFMFFVQVLAGAGVPVQFVQRDQATKELIRGNIDPGRFRHNCDVIAELIRGDMARLREEGSPNSLTPQDTLSGHLSRKQIATQWGAHQE